MIEEGFFLRIMLLLTTALGLSFLVERFLEFLNGWLKKLLFSELNPFVPIDALQTLDFYQVEAGTIRQLLDEKAEELAEIEFDLARIGSEPDAKNELEQQLEKKKTELDELVKKLKKRIQKVEQDPGESLTIEQKTSLKELTLILDRYEDTKVLEIECEIKEKYPAVTFSMEPIKPRDAVKTAQEFWLKLIGTFTGITICYFSEFGLFSPLDVFANITINAQFDWILTGFLIGGGSQPIHVLIKFLNQRKVVVDNQPDVAISRPIAAFASVGVGPPSFSSSVGPTFTVLDLPYTGGYRPEELEHRNRRTKNPELIVYHHTAMHSDTTFNDIVHEIKVVKGWSTAYHTVVMKNGVINDFCRWDRRGVHAKGANRRSLGISLNGNFHADPGDAFSNDQGQYGITRPTDEQLHSAAKVVALWCHLYDIPVEFGNTIVPHSAVRNTACPGSNFPHTAFEELVKSCFDRWKTPEAQAELVLYKQKQYIFGV